MEPVENITWRFLQKKLTAYNRKKNPPQMFETVQNNTNSYFDESFSPQLLTPSLNL